MELDSREKLEAALSVLNSCTMHRPPDGDALTVIAGDSEHPNTAPDEMASAVVEEYLEKRKKLQGGNR
jgi:hypothetical protein